jgi:PPK2 family polyphosphate:nucleotide phosphotransferase
MDDFIKNFRISKGKKFSLKDYAADFSADCKKEDAIEVLNDFKTQMDELQEKLYATNRYSLLIVFQAMDAAGKDSAIEHVMGRINPQGCQVFSFKQPSHEDYEHDFLWRHYKALPEKGRIGIHNRSHYENVLICKVHPEFLRNEGISYPFKNKDEEASFWNSRYESILNFEKHLALNGTVIIKFFLNVSKKEQKERFLDRINDPLKNWKFSSMDVQERLKWDEYMKVYEDAIEATSTEQAPWYVIPADKKWFTRIAISKIVVETLKSLNLQVPELGVDEKAKLEECKNQLLNE